MSELAIGLLATSTVPMESTNLLKPTVAVVLLTLFWCWETWWPCFGQRTGRWQHAGRNLSIAVCNTIALSLMFGTLTVWVANWTEQTQFGLLNQLEMQGHWRFILALVLLDLWLYIWHRANHMIPFLWRFHRMHHSDPSMDVTSATRFHLGEHVGASTLRLGLIPLLGFELWNLIVYDILVIAATQFHHADISLGRRWDRWMRLMIVTPHMHKVHHSDRRPETNSNYSTVLSVWDRLAKTFRMRQKPNEIVFGLPEFRDPLWQTWSGMWKTPLVNPDTPADGDLSSKE